VALLTASSLSLSVKQSRAWCRRGCGGKCGWR